MSYEIMTKDFSTTSYLTLATQIGTYITEQIPELTLARTYTSGSTVKIPFLQWDGTKAGFGIYGYISNSNYPVNSSSNGIFLFSAQTSTTSSKHIHNNNPSSNSFSTGYMSLRSIGKQVLKNSVYYVNMTVAIAKLSSGYVISIGGVSLYIGTYTSPIFGKCIVVFNMTTQGVEPYLGFVRIGNSGNNEYFQQSYYNFSCIFSEDGEKYYNGQGVTFYPDTNVISDNNAILCPMYFVCRDAWIEPFVIPDLYYMIAKTYPNTHETAQVGDVIAYKVSNNNCVVV